MKAYGTLAALGLLLGCANPAAPPGGGLAVAARTPTLYITNETNAPAYAVVFDASVAGVVEWAPCVDPSVCPGIAPGATAATRYDSILGFSHTGGTAVVYWWHLVPADPQALRADSIRHLTVRLW